MARKIEGGVKFFWLLFTVVCLLSEVGGASIVLDSVSITPNPAHAFETITITATGYAYDVNRDTNSDLADLSGWHEGETAWACQKFRTTAGGTLHEAWFSAYAGTDISRGAIYSYASDSDADAQLAESVTLTQGSILPGTACYWQEFSDFDNNIELETETYYWFCIYNPTAGLEQLCLGDAGDPYLYGDVDADVAAPVEEATINMYAGRDMTFAIWTGYSYNVQSRTILPGGDYNTDRIATSVYYSSNPAVSITNPVSEGTTFSTKLYAEEIGYSLVVQTLLEIADYGIPTSAGGTGIYIVQNNYLTGAISSTKAEDARMYGAGMHNWRSFAAGSDGGGTGKILVDGVLTDTCNETWDCFENINTGSHTYSLFSSVGGYQYTGTFNIDANTNLVRIYVPLTYNMFELYENSNEEAMLECVDIYSLTATGETSTNKRISAGLWIDGQVEYWNATYMMPANCYTSEGMPAFYPFPLPAFYSGIEPLAVMYSGSEGLSDDLVGLHYPGGISGTRHKNGEINFYSLYEEGDFYSGSGALVTGRIEQRVASAEDGVYSPLTTIVAPNMNYDSAIFGDANYNTGDFGFGDSVTCEAQLLSYGFAVYDINVLLLTDKNAIYAQWSFSPYRKYNSSMGEAQSNGAFNYVWHTFDYVDPGHSTTIQCAFQTSNELGYTSGWVISAPRTIWSTNLSAAGGIGIYVRDEDGSIASYGRYESPQDGDVNYIDVYNFSYQPYFWKFNTADNPFSLYEGDSIMAQTRDTNTSKYAGKTFSINRGDEFNTSLYLPDQQASDQAPVAFSTMLIDSAIRMRCRTSFYDKDLDWNNATFKIWNSIEGSITSPVCTYTQSHAMSTNCNPDDSPCAVFSSTATFHNECGSGNDCYLEKYFGKRDCTTLTTSGRLTVYCAIELEDLNGNITTTQATATIDVEDYYIFGVCEAYAVVDGENQPVIYTAQDRGYIECTVGVDNMLEPDENFTVTVWDDLELAYQQTESEKGYGQQVHIFRAEATDLLEAYARLYTTDSETWEGEIPVLITHSLYGSHDTMVHAAVVLVGRRVPTDPSEYGEAEFDEFYMFVSDLAIGLMTDPVSTVQNNFFTFLLIFLAIIILVPLAIAGALVAAKVKSKGD